MNRRHGVVTVGFVVTAAGKVADPRVEGSLSPVLDAEALRLVRAMPRWQPGKHAGKPVDVFFTMPIPF